MGGLIVEESGTFHHGINSISSGDGPAFPRSPSNLRGWRSSAQPFPRGQVRARVPASVIAPGATVHRGQGYMVAPRLAGQRAQYIERASFGVIASTRATIH